MNAQWDQLGGWWVLGTIWLVSGQWEVNAWPVEINEGVSGWSVGDHW